jgi:undecaprenyl-phosphate alpha-N-acetylglucosaminyl 1-phosphatetransferase
MLPLETAGLFQLIALPLFSTVLAIVIAKKGARALGLIDSPDARKQHHGEIPLVGGIGLMFTLCLMITLQNAWGSDLGLIALWCVPIFIVGLMDDRSVLHWAWRLTVQITAALGVIATTGLTIEFVGNYPILGAVFLGPLAIPLTVFAIVGLSNAFNMIDGVDGLCSGIALIALAGLWFHIRGADPFFDAVLIMLIIALLVFLAFNLQSNPKHKIFLGDAGSGSLGFLIGWFMIKSSQGSVPMIDPQFAVWLVALPLMDQIYVVIKRSSQKTNIFKPDRSHLHYTLADKGMAKSKVLMTLLSMAGGLVIIGSVIDLTLGQASVLILLGFTAAVIAFVRR